MSDSNGRPLHPKCSVLTNWTNTLFKFFGSEETITQVQTVIELIKAQDADKAKEAMEDLLNIGIEKLEKNYFNQ